MKFIWILVLTLLPSIIYAQGQFPEGNRFYYPGIAITNMAASTTNTSSGEVVKLSNVANRGVRITASAITYTNVGTVLFYFATSPDATSYDGFKNSGIFLTLALSNSPTATGAMTNQVSAVFNTVGSSTLRKESIYNQSLTGLTNIAVTISYPEDVSTQNR